LATHFIPSHRLDDVIESLASITASATSRVVDQLLNQFSAELQPYTMAPLIDAIDRVFMAPSLDEVVRRLSDTVRQPSSSLAVRKWATETLHILTQQASPTGLHATFKLIQKGASSTLKTALSTEMNLAQNYVERVDDLYIGIDSKLIAKSKEVPRWNPSTLSQVRLQDIDALFKKAVDPINGKRACA